MEDGIGKTSMGDGIGEIATRERKKMVKLNRPIYLEKSSENSIGQGFENFQIQRSDGKPLMDLGESPNK